MCDYDCRLPVALRNINGSQVRIGQFHTPTATSSDLPGLLGLRALQRNRAVLDFNTLQLHFCGPGSYDLQTGLPPETESFQYEIAPSGHLVLPCCEYEVAHNNSDSPLTLNKHSTLPKQPPFSHQSATAETAAAETTTSEIKTSPGKVIPPPPCFPPRLPILAESVWQTTKIEQVNKCSLGRLGKDVMCGYPFTCSNPSRPGEQPSDLETS